MIKRIFTFSNFEEGFIALLEVLPYIVVAMCFALTLPYSVYFTVGVLIVAGIGFILCSIIGYFLT